MDDCDGRIRESAEEKRERRRNVDIAYNRIAYLHGVAE